MTFRRILFWMGITVLSVSAVLADDLSGIWTGQTVDRNGDPQDVSFRFNWKGNILTGKMYGDNESTLISDASVTGNQISFMVTTELNGGVTKFLYTGTVNGSEMDIVRKRVDLKVTAPAKDPAAKEEAAKAAQPQHLRLKRIA
jgi:hypothetical protein